MRFYMHRGPTPTKYPGTLFYGVVEPFLPYPGSRPDGDAKVRGHAVRTGEVQRRRHPTKKRPGNLHDRERPASPIREPRHMLLRVVPHRDCDKGARQESVDLDVYLW
jgi:hypothetical protein